jgi:hypothetical protein
LFEILDAASFKASSNSRSNPFNEEKEKSTGYEDHLELKMVIFGQVLYPYSIEDSNGNKDKKNGKEALSRRHTIGSS